MSFPFPEIFLTVATNSFSIANAFFQNTIVCLTTETKYRNQCQTTACESDTDKDNVYGNRIRTFYT